MVLSVDELVVLSRLHGVVLPPALLEDGEDGDDRAHRAVLRGLVARGLLVPPAGGAPPAPEPELARRLTLLTESDTVVELDREDGNAGLRMVALAGAPPAEVVVLSERHPGIWALHVDERDVATVVADAARVEEIGARPHRQGWSAPLDAHERCDEAVHDGDPAGAATALRLAGVDPGEAGAWVESLTTRRSAVALRAACTTGPGRFTVDELRWVVDGHGGAWRLDVVDDAVGRPVSSVTPVSAGELGGALRDVLGRTPETADHGTAARP